MEGYMAKVLTKTFNYLLNLWGAILINWTVKSKEDQAFLPESDSAISLLLES
jgi:hypothetical protein